jgi:alcohol dehydrogenase class IV
MKMFTCSRVPQLHFGEGALNSASAVLRSLNAERVGIVTGGRSFRESEHWPALLSRLREDGIEIQDSAIDHEPDPAFVNEVTDRFRTAGVQAIMGIGGGSAIDAGKAISALATMEGGIEDYLEGVGTSEPSGHKLPYIAVPTTAGTGSEATKNAVISRPGPDGFKKSLRHDSYVPDVAIIDPDLSLNSPPSITAAAGLDAITQLLEAYVSTGATPFTDALAQSGLRAASRGFLVSLRGSRTLGKVAPGKVAPGAGGAEIEEYRSARADMAYAAYLSGICLANAGLGIVHGIAGPMGARYPIPHGLVCGSLLPSSVQLTIALLRERMDGVPRETTERILQRYANVAGYLGGTGSEDMQTQCDDLVRILEKFRSEAALEGFRSWGVDESTIADVAGASSGKSHPVPISQEDIYRLIAARL